MKCKFNGQFLGLAAFSAALAAKRHFDGIPIPRGVGEWGRTKPQSRRRRRTFNRSHTCRDKFFKGVLGKFSARERSKAKCLLDLKISKLLNRFAYRSASRI
uniref:Putative secreted protein n=1 Tax=Anopheles darlingi TaxID=43151 RepID=A0A2M4DLF7_ANODA